MFVFTNVKHPLGSDYRDFAYAGFLITTRGVDRIPSFEIRENYGAIWDRTCFVRSIARLTTRRFPLSQNLPGLVSVGLAEQVH